MTSETKLDNSFLEGQYLILRYSSPYRFDINFRYSSPYRFDRNFRGGIMAQVKEDIPSKFLSIKNQPIEGFYIEINLRKKKWLLCGKHNSHRNTGNHLDSLSKNVALYSSAFDNYIVISNFNIEVDSKEITSFSKKRQRKIIISV